MSEARLLKLWGELRKILAATHLEVVFSEQEKCDEGANFAVGRSYRGTGDMHCYCVDFNPRSVTDSSDEQLISDLFHEYCHMVLFGAWETGQEGRREPARLKYVNAHDSGVHDLERALAPLVIKAWKGRIRKRKKKPAAKAEEAKVENGS